ncbi:MAG: DUF202 domain-containing protein [Actinobacteria bacterium]|nr:DUF202 domain-containing protein [Actinomycetota bacterium]
MSDGSDDGAYERDAGLAAERTELAWDRSALSLFACGAAVVKGLPKVTGGTGHPVAGVAVLVLGGVVWASGLPYARLRAHATRQGRRGVARRRELLPMAAATAIVGVAAFVIGAFLPG